MIGIQNRPSTPGSLKSDKVNEVKQRIAHIVRDRGNVHSSDFPSDHWKKSDVRNALWESQSGKCCFCENKRAKKREFDAEHFRPKAQVTEDPDHLGYWWLAYEWDNLLYACKPCNQEYKKNHFPLLNGSRARTPEDDLNLEASVLINPIHEDPEEYIGFEWWKAYGLFVKAVGLDANEQNRGNETIRILGLNREELVEERGELTEVFEEIATTMNIARRQNNQAVIQDMREKIGKLTSSRRRFSGFSRAFFRACGLEQYVTTD